MVNNLFEVFIVSSNLKQNTERTYMTVLDITGFTNQKQVMSIIIIYIL